MSDSKQDKTEQPPEPAPVDFPDDVDPELASWLNRFEAIQASMDVTLTVDGFLVSGTPQSTAEFYRTIGDAFVEALSRAKVHGDDGVAIVDLSEAGAQVRETMESLAGTYDVPRIGTDVPTDELRERAEALKEEMLNTPRRSVLLKDVVILTPSGEHLHPQYWRGRLSHVSGWFFGRPSTMEYEGDA